MPLMERLEEERGNIDEERCIKLVESMPKQIQKCLEAKGGHFLQMELYLCRLFFLNKLLILKNALKFRPAGKKQFLS